MYQFICRGPVAVRVVGAPAAVRAGTLFAGLEGRSLIRSGRAPVGFWARVGVGHEGGSRLGGRLAEGRPDVELDCTGTSHESGRGYGWHLGQWCKRNGTRHRTDGGVCTGDALSAAVRNLDDLSRNLLG